MKFWKLKIKIRKTQYPNPKTQPKSNTQNSNAHSPPNCLKDRDKLTKLTENVNIRHIVTDDSQNKNPHETISAQLSPKKKKHLTTMTLSSWTTFSDHIHNRLSHTCDGHFLRLSDQPVYNLLFAAGPYKPSGNFRSPPIKEHFRGPSFPATKAPSFEYVPSSPPLNHVINSDDRGPIHEIPAPNLGPKPDHKPVYHHTEPKKPSYEVVESNDKIIEQSDGSKGYYAPDPDPSLPAPKIPPASDPHSIPSEAAKLANFPTGQEYQIVEAGPNVHAPIPNLSSQELYDLMHSFPNDQYTLVLPQPVNLYQPNSHQEIENNGLIHSATIKHEYQDFNHPQYQTFNYEENNPNSAAQPIPNYEQDTSDTKNSPTVVRNTLESTEEKKTESVKKTLPSDLSNLIPDDEFEPDQSQIFMKNEPEVPFYSSLPNQETAETLAALQAAGSVASKINQLKNEESLFGLPKGEVLKPKAVGQNDDYEEQKTEVEVQKSVALFEKSYAALGSSEEDDILGGLDVGQGAVSDRFGKKINPV